MRERTFYTWASSKPRFPGDDEPLIALDVDDLEAGGHKLHSFSPKQARDLCRALQSVLECQAEEFGYSLDDPPDWDVRKVRPRLAGMR